MSENKKTTNAPPPINALSGRGRSITTFIKPNPDYKRWLLSPYWSLLEASYLLCGCDPEYKKQIIAGSGQKLDPKLRREIDDKYDILHRFFMAGQLSRAQGSPYDGICYVEPQEFINWAINKGVDVPDELQQGSSPLKDKKTNPSHNSDLSVMGKTGADKRWKPHRKLLSEACNVAETKWAGGDEAWHDEMADWLLGKKEFKKLKENRLALLRALGPVAEKHDRKRGTKGVKKRKK